MAYQAFTGGSAATGFNDLLVKLITFLTTNSALVTAGQEWAQLADDGTTVFLKGQGLAGTDEIYVSLDRMVNASAPYYNLGLRGADGYIPGVLSQFQPNVSPPHYACLWNQPMDFWVFANGRRFIVLVKVNSTYQNMYAGFWLPDGTPSEMPYPLYIGASTETATVNWTNTSNDTRSFFDPRRARLRNMDGAWLDVSNYFASSGNIESPLLDNNVWPWMNKSINGGFGNWRDSPGGVTPLIPAKLVSTYSGGNNYGTLDGVYYIPGFNQAAENIVQWDGFDHFVVQDNFRSGIANYAAIRMN